MISMFDDLDDQVDTFNALFADVLNEHAPIKRIKIKARPHPLITEEIRQLINTRDIWHRRAIRSNYRLHGNTNRCFRQEVKRESRFAETAHVRTELLKSKGNTNAIWKIINNCLPRKSWNRPFITENPTVLANKFNKYFTSVESVTAQKACDLAIEHNFDIHPASSAVEPLPDQCSEAFQFHSVLDKDVERVIKCFSSIKAPAIGDTIFETLYLNRVTSENKRIHTPPLSPPFKVGVFVVFYR